MFYLNFYFISPSISSNLVNNFSSIPAHSHLLPQAWTVFPLCCVLHTHNSVKKQHRAEPFFVESGAVFGSSPSHTHHFHLTSNRWQIKLLKLLLLLPESTKKKLRSSLQARTSDEEISFNQWVNCLETAMFRIIFKLNFLRVGRRVQSWWHNSRG